MSTFAEAGAVEDDGQPHVGTAGVAGFGLGPADHIEEVTVGTEQHDEGLADNVGDPAPAVVGIHCHMGRNLADYTLVVVAAAPAPAAEAAVVEAAAAAASAGQAANKGQDIQILVPSQTSPVPVTNRKGASPGTAGVPQEQPQPLAPRPESQSVVALA